MTQLVLLYAGASVLLLGLSVPLIRGWVKPNRWYGFRLPLTLNNPDIWYPANRYAGWLLLIYGLVQFVVSIVLPFALCELSEEQATGIYGLCVAVLMLGGLVPVVVLSMRYARRLAEEHGEDGNPKVS